MSIMTAYPNKDKAMYLARVKAHRKADELVRGIGWESNGQTRGCGIGCTLHTYDHSKYPKLLGIPIQLAYLEDWLFENLPDGHLEWPERFLSAIIEGADLSRVWPEWVRRMLERRLDQLVVKSETLRQQCRHAIERVRSIYENGMPAAGAAKAAADAAGVASWAAGASWAAKAAADAAGDASWAASWAADAASWAADAAGASWAAKAAADAAGAASWAADAAGAASWAADAAKATTKAAEIHQMANDLIELLETAPIPN